MVDTLVEDFAQEIKQILSDEHYTLIDEQDTVRLPTVYAHCLPPRSKDKPPLVPWVLVSVYNGEQSSAIDPRRVTLHITNMIYDDHENMQGYRDALQMIEVICRHLYNQSFVGGKYEVAYPFEFAALDDVNFPYFAAGLAVKVELPGIAPQNREGGHAYV